jgi:hypothetical protein
MQCITFMLPQQIHEVTSCNVWEALHSDMLRTWVHVTWQHPVLCAGSAFIISEDGVCVTNAHVISGLRDIHAERIEVWGARVGGWRWVVGDPRTGWCVVQPLGHVYHM